MNPANACFVCNLASSTNAQRKPNTSTCCLWNEFLGHKLLTTTYTNNNTYTLCVEIIRVCISSNRLSALNLCAVAFGVAGVALCLCALNVCWRFLAKDSTALYAPARRYDLRCRYNATTMQTTVQ